MEHKDYKVRVALVDDHTMFRMAIAEYARNWGFDVVLSASHGQDFIDKLKDMPANHFPEIILLDINMPVMDGYKTTKWIKQHHPEMKIIILTMHNSQFAVIKMLKEGVNAYLLKESDPKELENAIIEVYEKGYSNSGEIQYDAKAHNLDKVIPSLTPREIEFLKLSCSDLVYKEVAKEMGISVRTVENYRDDLFKKLNINSRTGLAVFAIKNALVNI